MKGIFLISLFLISVNLFAVRPTVQASNLGYNNLLCTSVILQWTNGNGTARIIVAKEGSATDFTPVDFEVYTPNKDFGLSTQYGVGNYIVYNTNGTNFIKVDNLQSGKTYHFKIFEHDNNGPGTLYLTDNAPTISITTPSINLGFDIRYIDSCQQKNRYEFTNTSTSTISGLTYTFDFGSGQTSTSNPIEHSFKTGGLVPVRIIATPSNGCVNTLTKNVRVYNKRVAYIDYNVFKDTIQCLEGNYFDIDPTPVISPLLASYRYNWDFGDGTFSTFKRMKKSYAQGNVYTIKLEIITNVNLQPTGCKDTLIFKLQVLPNPAGGFNINKPLQCLTNNNFVFENTDVNMNLYKWYFSDGDSSSSRIANHSFKDTGLYRVIHVAFSNEGCKGRDTAFVRVVQDADATFAGINDTYCQSNNTVTIVPLNAGGTYSGYSTSKDFTPNLPGNHFVAYTINNGACSDSDTFNFEILKNPVPKIGNDTSICSGGSFVLNSNEIGQHTWSTGETTTSISVSNTGRYILNVKQGNCEGSDSIDIVFTQAPIVDLGRDTILCKGGGLRLNATNPRATYLWNNGSTDSLLFAFLPGKYKVSVTNPCGFYEDSIFITIQSDYCDLFMVNAFSPGNDLLNNVFMPRGRNITVKLFQIYNRWGELVFETDQNNVGWDGTFKNKDAEMGVYIWKLFYTIPNGVYIKKANAFGEITLLR